MPAVHVCKKKSAKIKTLFQTAAGGFCILLPPLPPGGPTERA